MDFHDISLLFSAVLALSLKPGPGMVTITSRTLSQGMGACFLFMAGLNIVSLFYLALVLTGLHFAKDDLIFLSLIIKSLAAVYLIWLGMKGLQSQQFHFNIVEQKHTGPLLSNFTTGLVLTLSNPLIILFYAGILPTILDVSEITWPDIIIIASVIIVVETSVAVAYCLPLALTRKFFTEKTMKYINLGSSIVLIIVGIVIGYLALPAKDLLSVF